MPKNRQANLLLYAKWGGLSTPSPQIGTAASPSSLVVRVEMRPFQDVQFPRRPA